MPFIFFFGLDIPLVEFLVILHFFSVLFLGLGLFQLSLINLRLKKEVARLSETVDKLRR